MAAGSIFTSETGERGLNAYGCSTTSVARAAKKLKLSPSAMSRALARLRKTTRDPLLVQAGRVLVPSPRAQELREQVARLVLEVETVLSPTEPLELKRLVGTDVTAGAACAVSQIGGNPERNRAALAACAVNQCNHDSDHPNAKKNISRIFFHKTPFACKR